MALGGAREAWPKGRIVPLGNVLGSRYSFGSVICPHHQIKTSQATHLCLKMNTQTQAAVAKVSLGPWNSPCAFSFPPDATSTEAMLLHICNAVLHVI